MIEYGLIGEKLSHSYSKIIHDMLGAYRYNLHPLAPADLTSFIEDRKYKGLNVTIPYKQKVLPLCDGLDPVAEKIGAVNTLYFKGDELWGTNTDYEGFLFMADRTGISLKNRKVLVLGSGGASRMVQVAASDRGAARVSVASRKGPLTYDILPKDAEIIINTTPVGMYPHVDDQPTDLSQFPNCKGVLDLIYNPGRTRLLLQAKDLGVPCSNGLSMLVAQATAAAKYFTGEDIFCHRNNEIIDRLSGKMINLVFIGMPGSGKSSLGKALAKTLHLEFQDTDDEIIARTGRHPADIITEDGEPAFRQLEHQVVTDFAKEQGRIIATGGGVVLDERNMNALRQNGRIIYIHRSLDSLPTDGRPLSRNPEALKKISLARIPLYERYADVVVNNDGSFEEGLAALIKAVSSSPILSL